MWTCHLQNMIGHMVKIGKRSCLVFTPCIFTTLWKIWNTFICLGQSSVKWFSTYKCEDAVSYSDIFSASALWIFLKRLRRKSLVVWWFTLYGHLQNGHSVRRHLFLETWHLSLIYYFFFFPSTVKWGRKKLNVGIWPALNSTETTHRHSVQMMWALLATDHKRPRQFSIALP